MLSGTGFRFCLLYTSESDAKDLLRSTISATVNKVCLDRYLEEYRKRREQAETIVGKEISLL